jgi:hypothetical protein
MDPGDAMRAGTRDAYCQEGGTVLELGKAGCSVAATGEPAFAYGGAGMFGMGCAEEARR